MTATKRFAFWPDLHFYPAVKLMVPRSSPMEAAKYVCRKMEDDEIAGDTAHYLAREFGWRGEGKNWEDDLKTFWQANGGEIVDHGPASAYRWWVRFDLDPEH